MQEITSYTETELTEALKKRDNNAYNYLYHNYKGALFTVILQIIADREIAEDVLQDAFITAWKNIEKYDAAKGRLFTWLFNVTRNCAINTTRSKNYKAQQKNDSLDNYVTYVDEKDSTVLNMNQIGLRKQVHSLREDYKNFRNFFMGKAIEIRKFYNIFYNLPVNCVPVFVNLSG